MLMSRAGWLTLAAVAVAGTVGVIYLTRGGETAPKLRKEKVERGDVVQTVTASGTLSATTTVNVGSQVSGIIAALHADFNSEVTTGQLVAELDPTPFQATVEQRRADLERARAELRQREAEFTRSKRLMEEQILSQGEYDTAAANRDGSRAGVKQAQASLDQALLNLSNTKITSPIDGVVVGRQVDVGQTVAASFQAPTLFTIARDLTKMQLLTNIDEADIGGIEDGQPASFTVDAFPDEPFRGKVSQVRLSPTTVQNVVTYPVVIEVDNPEGKLKPGMTANVTIPVEERRDVLRVPNAALRFKPDPGIVLADAKPAPAGGDGERPAAGSGPRVRGEGGGGARPNGGGARRGSAVYVEVPGGKVRAVAVKTSITDGTYTAIESDALKEGDEIVVGLATARATDGPAGRAPLGLGASPTGGGGRGPRM
jgi:HlyD family secretion protein